MEEAKHGQAECLSDFGEKLCLHEEYADVIFIVEQERLPAHRCILAASSEYFRALFYGNFAESDKKEIELDANLEAFKFLLKYIYTGFSDLSDFKINFNIELLKVANEYGYTNLVALIADNLIKLLSTNNLGIIINNARLYGLKNVYSRALKYVNDHASLVVYESKIVNSFSKEVLFDIIGRDSFSLNELDIFKAVIKWGETQTAEDLKFVLSNVRFTLMQISELRDVVAPTGVLKSEEIDEIIMKIKTLEGLPFRNGKTHRNQLDCTSNAIETEFGFKFTDCRGTRMFELPSEKCVNHICIKFERQFYSNYCLEVSRDKREWTRVIDFSKYWCDGDQTLYFDACLVRYIYIKLNVIEFMLNIKELVFDIDYHTFPPIIVDGVPALIYSNENKSEFDCLPKRGSVLFKFRQPWYINCMTTTSNFIVCEMKSLYKSVGGNEFKKLEYQSDLYGKCFFFDAQIAMGVCIFFKEQVPENFKKESFKLFYNPSKPSSIGTKL